MNGVLYETENDDDNSKPSSKEDWDSAITFTARASGLNHFYLNNNKRNKILLEKVIEHFSTNRSQIQIQGAKVRIRIMETTAKTMTTTWIVTEVVDESTGEKKVLAKRILFENVLKQMKFPDRFDLVSR